SHGHILHHRLQIGSRCDRNFLGSASADPKPNNESETDRQLCQVHSNAPVDRIFYSAGNVRYRGLGRGDGGTPPEMRIASPTSAYPGASPSLYMSPCAAACQHLPQSSPSDVDRPCIRN